MNFQKYSKYNSLTFRHENLAVVRIRHLACRKLFSRFWIENQKMCLLIEFDYLIPFGLIPVQLPCLFEIAEKIGVKVIVVLIVTAFVVLIVEVVFVLKVTAVC
mgnify:CR=1 FL=1